METTYHYTVTIFATTFGQDKDYTKSFHHEEKFKNRDLLESRQDANNYYKEKIDGLGTASYVFPCAGRQDFVMGENSAISVDLYLVECYKGEENFHSLSNPDDCEETAVLEKEIFSNIEFRI